MKDITPKPKRQGLTVLKPEDNFRFACHDGLECFTRCCRDTTIFLTPYDILRLKNALGISSETFLPLVNWKEKIKTRHSEKHRAEAIREEVLGRKKKPNRMAIAPCTMT